MEERVEEEAAQERRVKTVPTVVADLSTLIDELWARAKRTRSDAAYSRLSGMMISAYGILLKALDGYEDPNSQQAQIREVFAKLMRRRQGESASQGSGVAGREASQMQGGSQ